jgi:hypothetical protein
MESQETPQPKRRSRKKPTQVEPKLTTEEKVETPEPNKYAPKPKVGTPTIGRSANYVERVGIGNLKVITAHGNTDV